jgi:hypothetical protein
MHAQAQIEILRGNRVASLDLLEQAAAIGWRRHRSLSLNVTWDPLREDPRFQAIVQRVEEDLARQRAVLDAGEITVP